MRRRNPVALVLRTPQFRTRRTPTKTEKIRKLERKHRGRRPVAE